MIVLSELESLIFERTINDASNYYRPEKATLAAESELHSTSGLAIVCCESDRVADSSSWRGVNIGLAIVSSLALPECGRTIVRNNSSATDNETWHRRLVQVALPLSLGFYDSTSANILFA